MKRYFSIDSNYKRTTVKPLRILRVKELGGAELILHRSVGFSLPAYSLTEPRTGRSIYHDNDKNLCVTIGLDRILQVGRERFERGVKYGLKFNKENKEGTLPKVAP